MQASCTYGRETFESWGRKKRDLWKRSAIEDGEEQMRLSREIIVLDYGDEQNSPYSEEDAAAFRKEQAAYNPGGNSTDYHVRPVDLEHARVNEAVFSRPVDLGSFLAGEAGAHDCPTRSSVLGLAVTCAMLVVLYVCSAFCFHARIASRLSQ